MADVENEEDLFADLYDGEADDEPSTATAAKTDPEPAPVQVEPQNDISQSDVMKVEEVKDEAHADVKLDFGDENHEYHGAMQDADTPGRNGSFDHRADDRDRPIQIKDDGKMFIGGLNWETTDESLKNYFSQFGEVVECTVMRDGASGRSRGFGFLTFKDPKVVNTVMVKEHMLDNKLIDPKRAIPRDEQERTAKVFVGGVSQDASQEDFANFFRRFGNVLDATLMMDKETGRPRGFGFVTFDSEAAVDRTLEGPLAICGKPIEVKRAQPRGDVRESEGGGRGKFRHGRQNEFNNFGNANQVNMGGAVGNENAQPSGPNQLTPAMMAQYWARMQQYFMMAQQQQQQMAGMNPMAAMQQNPQMMQMMAQRGMNPQAMMQQMSAMQQGNGGNGTGFSDGGSPMNGGIGGPPAAPIRNNNLTATQQMMFEQRKYEQQQMARMNSGSFSGQNTWEGMYDDVPAPAAMQGNSNNNSHNMTNMGNMNNMRGGGGGFGPRGGRGGRGAGGPVTPQPTGQAPANAPTGPKNAGRPGGNYRGGGRGGGHRGYHPYARGGG